MYYLHIFFTGNFEDVFSEKYLRFLLFQELIREIRYFEIFHQTTHRNTGQVTSIQLNLNENSISCNVNGILIKRDSEI